MDMGLASNAPRCIDFGRLWTAVLGSKFGVVVGGMRGNEKSGFAIM